MKNDYHVTTDTEIEISRVSCMNCSLLYLFQSWLLSCPWRENRCFLYIYWSIYIFFYFFRFEGSLPRSCALCCLVLADFVNTIVGSCMLCFFSPFFWCWLLSCSWAGAERGGGGAVRAHHSVRRAPGKQAQCHGGLRTYCHEGLSDFCGWYFGLVYLLLEYSCIVVFLFCFFFFFGNW